MEEFIEKSGWFMPSVEGVLVKMGMKLTAFQSTKCGVYLFIHKTELHKKYMGKSHNLCQDMVHLFYRLFEKPESKLVACVDESSLRMCADVLNFIYCTCDIKCRGQLNTAIHCLLSSFLSFSPSLSSLPP